MTSKRCDCGKKMSFSYALSPRLKPKHSATKMFAASEVAAYLTVFRCSKIAALLDQFLCSEISANLTVFCCCKFNSNAASKIAVYLTAFAATCNMTDFAAVKLLLT